MATLRTRGWRDYNPMLLIAVLLLLSFSVPMVYSTTIGQSGLPAFTLGSTFMRHLFWIGGGVLLTVGLSLLDYHALAPLAWPAYGLSLVALAAVLTLGVVRGGAQSWLGSSSLSFQPTEPAKLVVVLVLALFWSQRAEDAGSWRNLILSLVIIAPILGLVLLQPDFGSAMVLIGIWLIMAFIAQQRWYQFGLLLLIAVPIVVYGWTHVLHDYQRYRLMVFLFPDRCQSDPEFAKYCWQTIQARRAIGNGGLTGMGLNHGIQSQLNYLPVQESDFIFAVTAEELGFIGAAVLIVLQLIVIWQVWRVVGQARDVFGRLLAAGVAGMLLVHCWENVGMNLIMMPMTGIPLPFVSAGGSFMLTTLAAIGLVQSVSLRQRIWSLSLD